MGSSTDPSTGGGIWVEVPITPQTLVAGPTYTLGAFYAASDVDLTATQTKSVTTVPGVNYGSSRFIQSSTFVMPTGVGNVSTATQQETTFASTGLSTPFGLAFDAAGNLSAANTGNSTIEKFTPGGTPSLFETETARPVFLAFQATSAVPEPSSRILRGLGAVGLLLGWRRSRTLGSTSV